MDTNQQPKAAHLAQELKAGEWSPNILQNEVALRQCAAEELLRLHAENSTLQSGYDAARLEIESLQARLQELGQMARECSDRKVVQLESALARHVRSGKDWAMRVEALERTITTLRAHIVSLNDQVAAEKKAMRELDSANSIALQLDARIKELEAQLDAVGAGGVEPLRKRECLHKIAEPDHFRGATEMVQASAPVVLPAPDVFAKVSHKGAAKWDVEFTWPVGQFEEDGDHKLYTEQQVRAMLAAEPQLFLQPLTKSQIWDAIRPLTSSDEYCAAIIDISMDEYRAIERAHGIAGDRHGQPPRPPAPRPARTNPRL